MSVHEMRPYAAADHVAIVRDVVNTWQRDADWFVYGWLPPLSDPNPMPRFRIWKWWP